MNLDKLAVVLRPRTNWEAIDLGVRMVQSWAAPVYFSWLSVYVPLAAFIVWIVGYELGLPGWAAVVILWLKPLFDRIVLFLLAHAVFAELHDWRDAWRALPSLIARTGLLRSLTWARLSPMRSFTQPVAQLEGLRGKAAQDRRRLLARQVGGAASWLTFAMLLFEAILLLALAGLVWLALPEQLIEDKSLATLFTGDDPQRLLSFIVTFSYIPIVAFLEPLYVASGFALYLKRRTDLEAWDVELALRRLRPPTSAASRAVGAVAAAFLALTLIGAMAAPPTAAADVAATAVETDRAARARETIAEVMQRPEFGAEQSFWRLKYVGASDETERDATWLQRLLIRIGKALRTIGKIVAQIGRVAMWVALGVLVIVVVSMSYRYWRQRGIAFRRGTDAPPAEVAGFDIRPESLPDDVAASAVALARAGRPRAALSLLYRAALSALAHRDHVEFSRGDAEGDCLRRVRIAASPYGGFFEQLTLAWQEVAYASREISLPHLEELCHRWPQYFATPR